LLFPFTPGKSPLALKPSSSSLICRLKVSKFCSPQASPGSLNNHWDLCLMHRIWSQSPDTRAFGDSNMQPWWKPLLSVLGCK
jgi:hypothetical protein